MVRMATTCVLVLFIAPLDTSAQPAVLTETVSMLVLQVSIDRHEGFDQAACSFQQGPVLRSVPAETLHRRNGMANQRGDQVVRKVLVKQYAHVSAGFRARAQELQWPVRVERRETV